MIERLKDTLLLVGDQNSDRNHLRGIFESTYNLLEAADAAQAHLLLSQNSSCIAAVLTDIPPEENDNIRTLSAACQTSGDISIPLIAIIAPTGTGQREEAAFEQGATDVVIKPYTPASLRRRLQILVSLFLHEQKLEKLVDEQSTAIRHTSQVMLDALSAIIEHRNTESGNHILRIRRFTKILLENVAQSCPEYSLTDAAIDIIASAAALHDIGKISIPDAILNKPGKLTAEEYTVIKTHTTIGGELIQTLTDMGDEEYLRYAYNIALYHHERWDGGGYPYGLSGDSIPICAQAVGLADAFDALTSPRVYKPALRYDQAINMILRGECGVFSPKLLECFKNVRTQFVNLAHQYADGYSPKSDRLTMPLPGPVWKSHRLDTLQLSQVKYHTLMHYVNDTVVEFDIDNHLYHVVYNPNPEFEALFLNSSYENFHESIIHAGIHPEDIEIAKDMQRYFSNEFFELGLRKMSFVFRVYSPSLAQYIPYEITLLRVNTQNADQRIALLIFHQTEYVSPAPTSALPQSLHSAPALYGLVSSAVRTFCDENLTIHAGAGDLFHLTGYTAEEIQTQFGGKLLELVLPDDRPALLASLTALPSSGSHAEYEYRILPKNGTPVWVLSKCRRFLESDGREYFYHAIRNNALGHQSIQQLQETIEQNRTFLALSDSIPFQLDLTTNTMTIATWREEQFGYPSHPNGDPSRFFQLNRVHPDDLPAVRSAKDTLSASACAEIEFRIANEDNKYVWWRARTSVQRDADGKPVKSVGLLTNIDSAKRAELALKEQAERDALTKLLNKTSTQQLISDYLESHESHALSAMMIIDLDNFKLVNDNYGHLYGDAILSQVGSTLKSLFRSHDIVGRIGGDEFLVFLRDLPNETILQDRCQLLVDTLRKMFCQQTPDLNVSCSIGAVVSPSYGNTYADLFRHADEALYLSKSKGKNTYNIYNPKDLFTSLMDTETRTITRIDSDELPGLANDSFVRYVFRQLYESNDLTTTLNGLLSYIGEQFGVSRVYIFENNDDDTACNNTFEWCNEGITPEIDHLQNISYAEDIPGWREMFEESGMVYCSDVAQFPDHIRAIVEPQGIKSMLLSAILDNGVFRGYVGFDECTSNRLWTQSQIAMLQFLAEVLALFLLKQRTQDKALEHADNLRSILDRQDAWIYVIDPDTFELRFLNAKAKSIAPSGAVGQTCYKVFMDRSAPCENCPAINIRRDQNASADIENLNIGVCVRARASAITWNREDSCLITCHERKRPS